MLKFVHRGAQRALSSGVTLSQVLWASVTLKKKKNSVFTYGCVTQAVHIQGTPWMRSTFRRCNCVSHTFFVYLWSVLSYLNSPLRFDVIKCLISWEHYCDTELRLLSYAGLFNAFGRTGIQLWWHWTFKHWLHNNFTIIYYYKHGLSKRTIVHVGRFRLRHK